MVRYYTGKVLLVCILVVFVALSGCLKHDNPLDPKNKETHGIGFTDIHSVSHPYRIRVSSSAHLYTIPSVAYDDHIVERFSYQNHTFTSLGLFQADSHLRDIAVAPVASEAALISFSKILILDTSSMILTDEISNEDITYFTDICYSSSGDRIYASSSSNSVIYVYDSISHELVETITNLPEIVFKLQVEDNYLYAFSHSSILIVSQYDITGEAIGRNRWNTNFPAYPMIEDAVAFVPSRNYLYYSDGSNLIYGELSQPFQSQVIPYSESYLDISVDPWDQYLYVGTSHAVDIYAINPLKFLFRINLEEEIVDGFTSYGIESLPDGKSLFFNSLYPEHRIGRIKIRF